MPRNRRLTLMTLRVFHPETLRIFLLRPCFSLVWHAGVSVADDAAGLLPASTRAGAGVGYVFSGRLEGALPHLPGPAAGRAGGHAATQPGGGGKVRHRETPSHFGIHGRR